jgi:hypothetical protein
MPPPSLGMVPFDWNNLVEPHLPSSAHFQISVLDESMLKVVHQCVVDEGSSASILSSSSWKTLGSPKLVLATSELIALEKIPSECLGILTQFPIMLGGNIALVNILVVLVPL